MFFSSIYFFFKGYRNECFKLIVGLIDEKDVAKLQIDWNSCCIIIVKEKWKILLLFLLQLPFLQISFTFVKHWLREWFSEFSTTQLESELYIYIILFYFILFYFIFYSFALLWDIHSFWYYKAPSNTIGYNPVPDSPTNLYYGRKMYLNESITRSVCVFFKKTK